MIDVDALARRMAALSGREVFTSRVDDQGNVVAEGTEGTVIVTAMPKDVFGGNLVPYARYNAKISGVVVRDLEFTPFGELRLKDGHHILKVYTPDEATDITPV